KCLEKDRNRRYATARDFANDLDRWRHGEPVTASPQTLTYLLGKLARRHWRPLAAAGSILALLCIGVAVAFCQLNAPRPAAEAARQAADDARQSAESRRVEAEAERRSAQRERDNAVAARAEAERNARLAKAEADRANRLFYRRQIAEAQRRWESGNAAEARR